MFSIFLKKKEKEKSLLLSSTQCPMGLETWSQGQALREGVGVEGNGIGSVVHGEEVPDVPGPEAGPTQGR